MAIQTDPAVSGLQAYASVSYADNYLEFSRLHTSTWAAILNSNKEKALVWASRLLNDLTYRGSKADVDQVLAWPRKGVRKENPGPSSETYSEDELPELIKTATCELAFHLVSTDRTLKYEENLGLSSLSVAGINLNFDHNRKEAMIPQYIKDMLKPISKQALVMRA